VAALATLLKEDPSAAIDWFRKVTYFFEYLLVRLTGNILNLFPFPWVLRRARPIGILLFWSLKRRRLMALENLHQAYRAQKSASEIQAIARESFVYLAEFGVEWLRMKELAKNPSRYLEVRDAKPLHASLREKKRGALLLVSHSGNWEIMALVAGAFLADPIGASIYALARPLKNPYLYEYVLRLRGLTGLKSIQKIGAVREAFKRLKENSIVCTLADQRVDEGSVQVKFFGREALTTSLPAVAALRFGTPVFFISLHRMPGPRYVMEVDGPLPVEKTDKLDHDIQVNTQRMNNRIEAEIQKDPRRWLWMHNRWRVRHGAKD